MTEVFFSFNTLWNIRPSWWTVAAELRIIEQLVSDAYQI